MNAFIRPIANTGLTDLVGGLDVEPQQPTEPAQEGAMIACGLLVDLMRDSRVAGAIPFFLLLIEEEAPGYRPTDGSPADPASMLQGRYADGAGRFCCNRHNASIRGQAHGAERNHVQP